MIRRSGRIGAGTPSKIIYLFPAIQTAIHSANPT